MNYLDLFAGIGGFALGFQQAGFKFEKHYASEVDKYAKSIYARQFPESIQLGDVTKIGDEHGKIDIITGGFPCQAFSIAGKREGFGDTRGTLFFEIERLARIYQPRYMVLENVKGLLNHDGGNTIRVILGKLRGLDYHVQMVLLNTKDFNVPQNRERVFFTCSATGERRPEIFHLRERKTEIVTDNTKCVTNCKNSHKVVVGTYRTHKDGQGFRKVQSGLCPTIPARAREDGSGQPVVAIPYISPARVEKRQSGRRFKENGDPMFTLTAQDRHGVILNENNMRPGPNIRRLTPVECERLQAYPNDWTKYGKDDEIISDSQRYKCLGNSVTVEVVKQIALCIKGFMETE